MLHELVFRTRESAEQQRVTMSLLQTTYQYPMQVDILQRFNRGLALYEVRVTLNSITDEYLTIMLDRIRSLNITL